MRLYDLCIAQKQVRNGEEKTFWNKIGIMMEKDGGKMSIQLYHIPGVWVSVFEQRDRNERKSAERPAPATGGPPQSFSPDEDVPF